MCTQRSKPLQSLEKLNYLLQFELCFVRAGDIFKGDTLGGLYRARGPCGDEIENAFPRVARLSRQQQEQPDPAEWQGPASQLPTHAKGPGELQTL